MKALPVTWTKLRKDKISIQVTPTRMRGLLEALPPRMVYGVIDQRLRARQKEITKDHPKRAHHPDSYEISDDECDPSAPD